MASPNLRRAKLANICKSAVSSVSGASTVTIEMGEVRGAKPVPDYEDELWNAQRSVVVISGTVRPPSAEVRIHQDHADRVGWKSAKLLELRDDGRFSVPVELHAGDNSFKLVARGAGSKPASVVIGIELPAAAAPPADTDEPASAPEPDAQEFAGNGSKNLGTIRLDQESVLEWTNDGGYFSVIDADVELFLNSEAERGDSIVEAGTYRKVEVTALGNWTITLRPR